MEGGIGHKTAECVSRRLNISGVTYWRVPYENFVIGYSVIGRGERAGGDDMQCAVDLPRFMIEQFHVHSGSSDQ